MKQLWFPANYVEEIEPTEEDGDSLPLGNLQKGTIDLTGVTVGMTIFHRPLHFAVVSG